MEYQQEQNQHQEHKNNRVIYDVTEGLQSEYTAIAYRRGFKHFLDHIKIHDRQVLLDYDPKIIESFIIDYMKHLRDDEHLSRMSIEVDKCAILRFFDVNSFDVPISARKRFKMFLPPDESVQDDRPYTLDEIRLILDKGCNGYDLRSKVIVLLLCSTGMRIGAIHTLQIGHLSKIPEYGLYRIQVYAHSKHDRYYTFCSPECATAIDSYLDYRKRFGENLTDRSPLIREQFNIDDKVRIQYPKPLSNKTIVHLVEQAIKRSGFDNDANNVRCTHGFRKYYITQSIKAKIDYNTREYLVGHRLLHTDPSYDRTSEEDRLAEYLKVVDLLTVSPEHRLQQRVNDLENKQAKQIDSLNNKIEHMRDWMNNTLDKIAEYTKPLDSELAESITFNKMQIEDKDLE